MAGMTFPNGETVTVLSRVLIGRDADNNDTFSVTSRPVRGVAFVPASSSEDDQGQMLVTSAPMFLFDQAMLTASGVSDIRAVDAIVRADGSKFEVEGDPEVPVSPFSGWAPGVVVRTKRVTG